MPFPRSAHAAIGGYLYQAWLGVLRWLSLVDGEILFCEGDEDLDQLLLHGVISEQVKRLAGKANIRTQPVTESLAAFIRTFVRCAKTGETRRFRFTTTAALRPQHPGTLDILASWGNPALRQFLIQEIRDLLGDQIPSELQWLDSAPHQWDRFIDSVEWDFDAPDVDAIQAAVCSRLETAAPGLPATLVADRLLATMFKRSSSAHPGVRMLQTSDLRDVFSTSRVEIESWAATYEALNVRDLSQAFADALADHDRIRDSRRLTDLLRPGTEPLRPDPTPAEVLRAGAEAIPFAGQEEQIAALDKWLASGDPVSVCLVTGPAGGGKTRLALHWIRSRAAEMPNAGFLAPDASADDITFLARHSQPRTVVIDYAETRTPDIEAILRQLGNADPTDTRVRILLIARNDGSWWRQLGRDDYATAQILTKHIRIHLGEASFLQTVAMRQQFFETAVAPLGVALTLPYTDAQPPDLSRPHFGIPLFVLMATIASLNGKQISGETGLLDATLAHEQRYWNKAVRSLTTQNLDYAILKQVVRDTIALLTLWGGAGSRSELRAAILLASRPDTRPDLTHGAMLAIESLYGPTAPGDRIWVRGLEPDLLGEHLIAQVVPERIELLPVAVADLDSPKPKRALTVLTRLAQHYPLGKELLTTALTSNLPSLAKAAVEVGIETGDPIGSCLTPLVDGLDIDLTDKIWRMCAHDTIALGELSLACLQRVVRQRRERIRLDDASEVGLAQRAELVGLLNNLGIRLIEQRRYADAEREVKAGGRIAQDLCNRAPDIFLPEAALILSTLGNVLSKMGKHRKAVEATRRAVKTYEAIKTVAPTRYFGHEHEFDIALSLARRALGTRLATIRGFDEGLEETEASVALLRQLAEGKGMDHTAAELIAALGSLSVRLCEAGRLDDSYAASAEALELARWHAESNPDRYLPALGHALHTHGLRSVRLGRRDEGLRLLREAVELRRKLATRRPERFHKDLADSLSMLGLHTCEHGLTEDGLSILKEAKDLYARLAIGLHLDIAEARAGLHHNLAKVLFERGRTAEAIEESRTAVLLMTPLFLHDPGTFHTRLEMMFGLHCAACDQAGSLPDPTVFRPMIDALCAFKGEPSPFGPVSISNHPPARELGRNDPCPCGSGRKFKKCCGR